MKKILIAIMLFTATSLYAEHRTMEDVMAIANKYLPNTTAKRCISSRDIIPSKTSEISLQKESFYVITPASQAGFVIVSADTRMPELLAQSDKTFPEEVPSNVRWLLQGWEDAYQAMERGEMTEEEAFPRATIGLTQGQVGPLLGNIEYNQGEPYNRMCPDGSVTGCVATAMAQIMRYYKYPRVGTGLCYYTGPKGGSYSLDLSQVTFDWDNILENYGTQKYDNKQAEAVAKLMIACGVSVNMNYATDGSGTQSTLVQKALVNNFFYHSDAKFLQADGEVPSEYVYMDWIWALTDNFKAGHPVYFSGHDVKDYGHAFVIDGYKAEQSDIDMGDVNNVLFHLNWGWGGQANGWFYLNKLNADGKTEFGYVYGNQMIINIYPPNTAVENVEVESTTQLDKSLPIYNIFGLQVSFDNLERGQLYFQKGKKIICK